MKKIITLILIFISTIAISQNYNRDIVHLKNGSTIKGVIIEQVPSEYIKIETVDGSIFVYQMEEIKKLTKDLTDEKSFSEGGLDKGYKGIVEVGYQIGTGDFKADRIKLNIINGYQFNPYFSMGFGTGLRYYTNEEVAVIPVFGDFRVNFMDNKVSPYLALAIGYSFDATNSFDSVGFLFEPVAGVSYRISERNTINGGIGYEMQKTEVYYGYYYGSSTETLGAIVLNVGISF